jgi:integrase
VAFPTPRSAPKLHPSAYLKLRGLSWYFVMAIPVAIRHRYPTSTGSPQAKVVVALGCRDLSLAQRRRTPLLAKWQTVFDRQLAEVKATEAPIVGDKTGDELRQTLLSMKRDPNESEVNIEAVEDIIIDHAERLEITKGPEEASRWYKAVTAEGAPTLRQQYALWQKVSGHSPVTVQKDKAAIDNFLRYLKRPDVLVTEITPKIARAYAVYLATEALSARNKPLALATRRAYVAPLSSLGAFMVDTDVVQANPFMGLRVGKGPSSNNRGAMEERKRAYTDDELLILLNAPAKRNTMKTRYPDSLVFEVLFLLRVIGCRTSELLDAQAGDIELKPGHVLLHIRSSKTMSGIRAIPIVHELAQTLLRDRRKRTLRTGGATAALFPEYPIAGVAQSRSKYFITSCVRLRDSVGFTQALDNHGLRRTFVTAVLEAGAQPIHVQHYVGHKVTLGEMDAYASRTGSAMLGVANLVKLDPKVEAAFRRRINGHITAK